MGQRGDPLVSERNHWLLRKEVFGDKGMNRISPTSNLGVVLSLFLKPLKCKNYFALFLHLFLFCFGGFWPFFLLGYSFFVKTYFLGFLMVF